MKQFSHKSIRRPLAGRTVLCSLFSVLLACGAYAAEGEESSGWTIGGGATLDFTSKQLTYGLIDNPHAIVTPSVELSIANEEWFTLTFSVDAIFDTTNYGAKDGGYADRRWKYQELTPGITLSKNWDTTEFLGSTLDTSINYTYEYHPRACNKPLAGYSNPDTQWLNIELGLPDLWLQPAFTLEYQLVRQGPEGEETGKGGIYATFSVAHDFDLGADCFGLDEGILTLTPTLGFAIANRDRNEADFGENESFMFRDGFASIELAYSPFEGFTIAPYAGCHYQLDSDARDIVGDDDFVAYGGVALSYSF